MGRAFDPAHAPRQTVHVDQVTDENKVSPGGRAAIGGASPITRPPGIPHSSRPIAEIPAGSAWPVAAICAGRPWRYRGKSPASCGTARKLSRHPYRGADGQLDGLYLLGVGEP
jgi:hypothetical protein